MVYQEQQVVMLNGQRIDNRLMQLYKQKVCLKSTQEYVRSVYEKKNIDDLIIDDLKQKIDADEQNRIEFYKIDVNNDNMINDIKQ